MKKLHEIYPDCSWEEREIDCFEEDEIETALEWLQEDLEELAGSEFSPDDDPDVVLRKIEAFRTSPNDWMWSYVTLVDERDLIPTIVEWKNAR